MGVFSSLKSNQREAIGLLSIGTFLEYFDLMLYVHMAVFLNELFFPKTDPYTCSLLSAMAFCSTYIFRPIGALIFGYIGDTVGRKATVIITTFMMAIACIMMALLPTYAQIGIAASFGVTICRIIQGIASIGEIMGAELYLTELIKRPANYFAVCLMLIACNLGTVIALSFANAVFSLDLGWRTAFWIGALIALIGSIARTTLREAPEFVDAKCRIQKKYEKANLDHKTITTILQNDPIINEKVNKKTSLAYFFIKCARPLTFYFIYIYCGNLLKNIFNYSAEEIIHHNLMVSIIDLLSTITLTYLSCKIYPLKIVKTKIFIFCVFILFAPYVLSSINTPAQLFLLQSFVCFFCIDAAPADAIFFVHFPIFKRFTYSSCVYALSGVLTYIVTSFGLVFLTEKLGYMGLLVIFTPITVGFLFGINHFEMLEKQAGNYPQEQTVLSHKAGT